MQYFFTGTIKRIIILALSLSLLLPFAMLLYSGLQRYREAHDDVTRREMRVVGSIADDQQFAVENVFTVLSALLKFSALQNFSVEGSSELFKGIVHEHPFFFNIFIMSPGGAIISSAVAVPETVSLAGTLLHSGAWRTRGATVVAIASSVFSGSPVAQFALPIFDRQGRIFGYLGAEIWLELFTPSLGAESLPYNGVLHILSASGRVIWSSDPNAPPKGGRWPNSRAWDAMDAMNTGAGQFAYTDDTGRAMLAAYRLNVFGNSNTPAFYTVLTVPYDAAYGPVEKMLRQDMAMIAVGACMSLAAGLFLGFLGFARPVKTLLGVADRLASGDAQARIGDGAGLNGELADLGKELDAMAVALEERNAILQRDQEATAKSSRAKNEFLANMSHEIRTPMNAILGMAHFVGKTSLDPSQQVQVGKIREAAEVLLSLLNNILDYSRLEAGKMQFENIPFHMGRLLNKVRGACAAYARERGSKLVTSIAAEVPPVLLGDPNRFGQALAILLHEAVRNAGGAAVTIGLEAEESAENSVLLRFVFAVRGHRLELSRLEGIKHALDGSRADSLDNAELGLVLSSGIIRMLNGRAEVENHDGGFSMTASVRLAMPDNIPEEAALRFDGEMVLLVSTRLGETPVDLGQRALAGLLSRYNLRAEECEGIDEAAARLQGAAAEGTPFTLVIADISDLAEEAAAHIEKLKNVIALSCRPLLVLSAKDGIKNLPLQLVESDIDAFLPKPVSESLLVNTLSGLICERGSQQEDARRATERSLGGLRVLLVEDNNVNLEIAEEILKSSGALVKSVCNGLEAVTLLAERPDFDLVLMDLEMPVMTGIEATRVLREERGFRPWRLPIIAMTAHNSLEEVSTCLEAGMNDHCLKPIVVTQLFEVLERWQPLKNTHAEAARRIMRKMRYIIMRSHLKNQELSGLAAELSPFIGEGRTNLLRDMFNRQETPLIYAMLDDYINSADNAKGE